MPVWKAAAVSEGGVVGCLCPDTVVQALRESFGDELECDGVDRLADSAARAARNAVTLGIRPDSPVVQCAARNERSDGPRYAFRLRVGPGATVAGRVDRGSVYVVCDSEAEFPEPARGRFVAFLRSLRLGEMRVVVLGGSAERPTGAS
jgi:hypothetical protein